MRAFTCLRDVSRVARAAVSDARPFCAELQAELQGHTERHHAAGRGDSGRPRRDRGSAHAPLVERPVESARWPGLGPHSDVRASDTGGIRVPLHSLQQFRALCCGCSERGPRLGRLRTRSGVKACGRPAASSPPSRLAGAERSLLCLPRHSTVSLSRFQPACSASSAPAVAHLRSAVWYQRARRRGDTSELLRALRGVTRRQGWRELAVAAANCCIFPRAWREGAGFSCAVWWEGARQCMSACLQPGGTGAGYA